MLIYRLYLNIFYFTINYQQILGEAKVAHFCM